MSHDTFVYACIYIEYVFRSGSSKVMGVLKSPQIILM